MASFSVLKRDPDPLRLCSWPEDLEGNCILSVERMEVHVNKPYLSMQSPVFHRMFYGDFTNPDNRYEVIDVDKEAFIEMLRVILPCRKRIDENNVESLLVMADRFEMDNLRKDCFAFKEAKEQQDKKERMYQTACRLAGEAELRAERAENRLDSKPPKREEGAVEEARKKKEELEKRLVELSMKLDASQFNEKKLEQENSSLREKNLVLREEIVSIKDDRVREREEMANLKEERTSDRERIYELTRKVAQFESRVLVENNGIFWNEKIEVGDEDIGLENTLNEQPPDRAMSTFGSMDDEMPRPEQISSGTCEMGKRRRASKMAHKESMEDSDEDGKSKAKRKKIDGVKRRKSSGPVSQSNSSAPKIDAKRNCTEIECHLCEFHTRNVGMWIKHLRDIHSSTLVQENMALLCMCGHESQSARHSHECTIANFTVIKRGNPTTPKCVFCEVHPKTAHAYAQHIYYHNSTLTGSGIYLTCACGVTVRSNSSVTHAKEECDGREFTLHIEDDEK